MADSPPPFTIEIDDDQLADALRAPRREYVLTAAQTARVLGVHVRTVYRYVGEHRLTAYRPTGVGPGRRIRIPATEVAAMAVAHIPATKLRDLLERVS